MTKPAGPGDADEAELVLAAVDGDKPRAGRSEDAAEAKLLEQVDTIRSLAKAFDALAAPAPATAQPPAPARWGDLELIQEIGKGRFGCVYRAWDRSLQREVALKLFAPGSEEGVLLARVNHPNVVTVFGSGTHDARPGIWMELIRGATLAKRVQTHGPLPPAEALAVTLQVCDAVAAVHAARVVHQDVKASNVMVQEDGRVVLMDFGSGRQRHPPAGAAERLSGTPLYMAPEVVLDGSPSPASDVYSIGVLLHYLLTGTYPVYAPSFEELRRVHARNDPDRAIRRRAAMIRQLRPEVSRAVARCVAQACAPVDLRFRTALDLKAALERASRSSWPSWALWTAAASLALLALGFWGASKLASSRTPDPASASLPVRVATQPSPVAEAPSAAPQESVEPARAATSAQAAGDSYAIEAALSLRTSTGDRPLASGDRVSLGDALVLTTRASRPVHVYVINEDEQGSTSLLFPLSTCELSNPLAAGRSSLPGRCNGAEMAWQVSSRGGREHFLIVASPERLPELEQQLARLAVPSWGGTPRGVGALVGAAAPAPRLQELKELARIASEPKTHARGVWVKEVVLRNE
jgi:serine/threonine-protein kinase